MLECRHTDQQALAQEWFSQIQIGKPFPNLIFGEGHSNIVFSFWRDGALVGIAYGHKYGENSFLLVEMKLAEGYVSGRNLAAMLVGCFEGLKNDYGVASIQMTLEEKYSRQKPYLYRILSGIPGYRVGYKALQRLGIRTEDFFYLRKYNWYRPKVLGQKGVEVILWKDYPEVRKMSMAEKENKKETEKDYLSPGIAEPWAYDPDTSFVLTDREAENPLGWFITEKIDRETIKVRRFYIYSEARKRGFGAAALAKGLDGIAEYAKMLLFDVEHGNRQMEKIVDKYCAPILAFRAIKYSVTIVYNK